MTEQDISQWILERIQNNDYMIEQWFDMVRNHLSEQFKRTGHIITSFRGMTLTARTGEYKSFVVTGMDTSDSSHNIVREQNFTHGYPIMVCSFACMATIAGQRILFLTKETPLTKDRYIFTVRKVNKRPHIIYDEYLSTFSSLPIELDRFNRVIVESPNKN